MNDTSKKALIVLAGLAILIIVYMYVFRSAQEDIEKLDKDITTLQTRLDDLIAKEQQKDQLIAETAQFNENFQKVLEKYPADLNQETAVMFFKGIEVEKEGFINNSFTLPKEAEFYTLGGKATGFQQDALSGEELNKEAYKCTTVAYGVNYSGPYDKVKEVLHYVADYRYRMNVASINISHEEATDNYTGSIVMNAYAISGPDRTPESVDPGLPAGTDNLFFAGDGSTGKSTSSSKYESDKGAAIVTSNNLLVILNSANSDLSSGIIASSNADKEETYVSSNENSRVELAISVYSEDGKNFMKYSIGGKSYTTEILSEDIAIYVKSSARVDANDTNGVDVTITNTSTLPVYFKVVDDDATSPRFKLGTHNGSVKVYK